MSYTITFTPNGIPGLRILGKGDKKLIVLHGFTQSRYSLIAPLTELWRSYGTTDFLDCPSHGTSRAIDHRALFADLDELTEGADLLGYSLGGRLALWYVATHRTKLSHVIALSAHLGHADEASRAARAKRDEDLAAALEATPDEGSGLGASLAPRREFLASWNAAPIFGGRALTPSQLQSRLGTQLSHLARSLRNDGTGAQLDLGPGLATSRTPLVYLFGQRDDPYRAQATRLAGIRPNAIIAEVPQAGHDVLADNPVATCATLKDALSR